MSAILKTMQLQDRYTWEAEMPSGQIFTEGGELDAAVRVSLLPAKGTGLPRHDLVVPCSRRFCRAFAKGLGGGLREYLHCIVADSFRIYVRSTDGRILITPPDYELYL